MTDGQDVQPDALVEDQIDLAAYGFRVAQENCVSCRNYHAVWGYERLARLKGNTFETEREILGRLMRQYTPQAGRIMIAGAADAGLLALAAQETRSLQPRIAVVDHCPTPLLVCRRYAEASGLTIATAQKDLTIEPIDPSHHLAFAHNILMHLSLPLWDGFMRNVCLSLKPGGAFLLAFRERPFKESDYPRLSPADYSARVLAALSAQQIALPEDKNAFGRRLVDFAQSKLDWPEPLVGFEDIEARLNRAGFAIAQHFSHDLRRTLPPSGVEAKRILSHILLAIRQ